MRSLMSDLRHGVRLLVHKPGFALVAILSLAVGIGANTTIFSVVNGILFRPLPGIADRSRLVDVYSTEDRGRSGSSSFPDYEYYRDYNQTLEGLAAFSMLEGNLNAGDQPEQVFGMIVTGNFFDVLGAKPTAGRFFLPDEDRVTGASPVLVLSYGLWQRRFGADPRVVGTTVRLNAGAYTIVGVAQEGFGGAFAGVMPDLWVPMMMQKQAMGTDRLGRNASWLEMRGRLKPGVAVQQAQADLGTLSKQLDLAYPATNRDRGVSVESAANLPAAIHGMVIGFMGILMAIVGLVLLIACSNVASMSLARTAARRKEMAIRLAIGAGRGRIIRQVLAENVALFLAGGGAGVIVARWGTRLIMSFKPPSDLPLSFDFGIDGRVLGFTLVISLVTGLLFGLSPAVQASRADILPALKSDSTGGDGRRSRLRGAFVVAQIAVSLVLLIESGLFLRSLGKASGIDPGFKADDVQTVAFNLSVQGYDEARGREFYRQLTERTRSAPGVVDVSLARIVPLSGNSMSNGVTIEGHEAPRGMNAIAIDTNIVTPDYFDTMQIPILSGRKFTDADRKGAPPVAIVNETMANRYYPGGDAIDKTITLGGPGSTPAQIVGIVHDGKYGTLGEDARPYFYLPFDQSYSPRMILHFRTAPNRSAAAMASVRREVHDLDPDLAAASIVPMTEQVGFSLMPLKLAASVAGILGLVGLVLASIGAYGVISYSVVQRTREIGICMALGAGRGAVRGMVVKQGAVLALTGIAIGLLGSFALTRTLVSLLYGIGAADAVVFAGMALLLGFVALVATYLPARRATLVDPMIALRYE
jgi:predicted permease